MSNSNLAGGNTKKSIPMTIYEPATNISPAYLTLDSGFDEKYFDILISVCVAGYESQSSSRSRGVNCRVKRIYNNN